jgi:hypothetical protein
VRNCYMVGEFGTQQRCQRYSFCTQYMKDSFVCGEVQRHYQWGVYIKGMRKLN